LGTYFFICSKYQVQNFSPIFVLELKHNKNTQNKPIKLTYNGTLSNNSRNAGEINKNAPMDKKNLFIIYLLYINILDGYYFLNNVKKFG
jgi:hypothetical protein